MVVNKVTTWEPDQTKPTRRVKEAVEQQVKEDLKLLVIRNEKYMDIKDRPRHSRNNYGFKQPLISHKKNGICYLLGPGDM